MPKLAPARLEVLTRLGGSARGGRTFEGKRRADTRSSGEQLRHDNALARISPVLTCSWGPCPHQDAPQGCHGIRVDSVLPRQKTGEGLEMLCSLGHCSVRLLSQTCLAKDRLQLAGLPGLAAAAICPSALQFPNRHHTLPHTGHT